MNSRILLAASLVAVLFVALMFAACERKVTEVVETTVEPEAGAAYMGSATCEACHSTIYENFMDTGHPYKLNRAADVAAGNYYPFSDVPNPPSGYTWDDVTYVIGGYGWKARFIGTDGYIITAGGSNQWNLETEEWSDYHADEEKPYNCGSCHTTGYDADTTKHQDGLEGIIGEWAFPGIQCEACHGPGSKHVTDPYGFAMKIDRTSAACGECHIRGDVGQIPASGGFIRHHEQYNEMMASKKASMNCVDCHDPHLTTVYEDEAQVDAIRLQCESCHFEQAEAYENSTIGHYASSVEVTCVTCHMPDAAKSAVSTATYVGDVASHLFAINPDSTAALIDTTTSLANGYLTLDYVCLPCHTNKDKQWASENADLIHPHGGS